MNSVDVLGEGVSRETFGDDLLWVDPEARGLVLVAAWARWHPKYRALHLGMRRLAEQSPQGLSLLVGRLPAEDGVLVAMARSDHSEARSAVVACDAEDDSRLVHLLRGGHPTRDVEQTEKLWVELGRRRAGYAFVRRMDEHLQGITDGIMGVPAGERDARRRMALALVCRTLFLAFMLEQELLPEGSARRIRRALLGHDAMDLHQGVLNVLFHEVLNCPPSQRVERRWADVPFLNGGLFERIPEEERWPEAVVPDFQIHALCVDLLRRFRISGSESYHPSTVDPEILGRLFENWMTKEERKQSGTFYTPTNLVDRVCKVAMQDWLQHHCGISKARLDLLWSVRGPKSASQIRKAFAPEELSEMLTCLQKMRCLDPACGSGAFLIGVAEQLLQLETLIRNARHEPASPTEILERIVSDRIFGVDLSERAVFLCQVRLWLLVASVRRGGQEGSMSPLPNLVHQIRVGNALLNTSERCQLARIPYPTEAVRELRRRAIEVNEAAQRGTRKAEAVRGLLRAEREVGLAMLLKLEAQQREDRARPGVLGFGDCESGEGEALQKPDETEAIEALRDELRQQDGRLSFDARIHFAPVFTAGGFDIILGNPPWLRISKLAASQARAVRRVYRWCSESADSRGESSFGVQADLSVAFLEQSLRWLRGGGLVSMIVPSKLLCCRYAAAMRNDLERTRGQIPVRFEDLGDRAGGAFRASVYPAVLSIRKGTPPTGEEALEAVMVRVGGVLQPESHVPVQALSVDPTPAAPWFGGDSPMRAQLRARLEGHRRVIDVYRIRQGLRTGANRLLLRNRQADNLGNTGAWRPILRGRDLYGESPVPRLDVLFAHDPVTGEPWESADESTLGLPAGYALQLAGRRELRKGQVWWRVFRVFPETLGWRVVWPDISMNLYPIVLPPVQSGAPLVLNSAYVIGCASEDEARRLCSWLRTRPVRELLEALAEPALNGYLRLQGHAVGRLPLPEDVTRAGAHWSRALERTREMGGVQAMEYLNEVALALLEGRDVASTLTGGV